MSTWKDHATRISKEQAKRPPGCKTADEIRQELGCNEKKAREIIRELLQTGMAERVNGKSMTASGALVPIIYYRLTRSKK